MNIKRAHLFRAVVMVTLISSSIYLTYGNDSPPGVYIVMNVAWNDFIAQIATVPHESPQDSLSKEMLIIHKFLKSQETEVRVGPNTSSLKESRQGSGNAMKRAALQGRASKVREATYGILDRHRLCQV